LTGHDCKRRVTNIVEIVGMDRDVITTQPLFIYRRMKRARHG
jgi:Flp pilus assembly CpaF family ATPase